MDNNYLAEVSKLRMIEDYDGRIFSILDDNKLINKDELNIEMAQSIAQNSEAPIVVVSENGERLSIVSLYLSCVYKIVHKEEFKNETCNS